MTEKQANGRTTKQHSIYWTEGIIDAIALEEPLRVRLVPASAFLFEEATQKRVLFITETKAGEQGDAGCASARLVDCCSQNSAGKECLWFSVNKKELQRHCTANLMLLAKTSRSCVRVGVEEKDLSGKQPFALSMLMFV